MKRRGNHTVGNIILFGSAIVGGALILKAVGSAKAATKRPEPLPPGPKPGPLPEPPIPPTFVFPVGTVVNAMTPRIGRRAAGKNLVKVIDNLPDTTGDYTVVAADCFFPDSLCSSVRIRRGDILNI